MPDHDCVSITVVDGWTTITCRCEFVVSSEDDAEARRRFAVHHASPEAHIHIESMRAALRKGQQ